MRKFAAVALGVVTAIGGFVDIGELVTLPAAGGTYRFALLWVLAVSVVGAMVYAEMAGRIELASQRAVFEVMRERLGFKLGVVPLLAVIALNVLTLSAEIAGHRVRAAAGRRRLLPVAVGADRARCAALPVVR